MKLLHTADWQLGLKLRAMSGDRGARARDLRFTVVETMAALAHREGVELVVVAGDVFEHNQVSPHVIERTCAALEAFAPLPVVLIPGNHDAGVPQCALARLADRVSDHVHVLLEATPIELAGVEVLPCPLVTRHTLDDPAAWVPPRDAGDTRVRVVVAHGAAHGFGGDGDAVNRIDTEELTSKGVDYVALGDWHGLKVISPRVAYSGAPEATRFKEQNTGQVLLVDIAHAGAEPQLTPERVARLHWLERSESLRMPAEVDALIAWLDGLSPVADTLVKLRLDGALSPADRNRLDVALERASERLLHLQIRSDEITLALEASELGEMDAPGFVGEALEQLLAREDVVHQDAARLLLRLLAEARA